MKTMLRATAMIGALLTTPAAAADLYGKAPAFAAAPFSGYNWNGAYVGVNLGYQWGKVTNWPSTSPNGIMGGAQVGYNWQIGQFVFGAEADLQGSGAEDTFAAYKFSNPWFGTVRGRAGYAMNNVLAYATGGLAYGGGRVDFGALERDADSSRLDDRRGRRGRPDAELDRQGRVSLCAARRPRLRADRRQQRLPVERLPARRELSLLSGIAGVRHSG